MVTRPHLLAWVAVAALACDGRDPTNPFDPENPDTGGAPDWLIAIADDASVALSWRAAPRAGFEAYDLERAVDDGSFQTVARIRDAAVVTYDDSFVENGATYTYRLSIAAVDDEVVTLPEKLAAPGSARPWILESGGIGLVRSSPDARHLRVRTGILRPFFDAAPADSGEVWTADYGGDRIVRYDGSGTIRAEIDIESPYRLARDAERARLWVASWEVGASEAELVAFDEATGLAVDRVTVDGEIRDIDIHPIDGSVVGAMGQTGGWFAYAFDGALDVRARHGQYTMVERGADDDVWLADPFASRVVRASAATGTPADSLSDEAPLALHAAGDVIWIADDERVRALDRTFEEVDGFDSPGMASSMAFDAESDALWIAQPIDDRVSRVDLGRGPEVSPERVDISLFDPFLVVLGGR